MTELLERLYSEGAAPDMYVLLCGCTWFLGKKTRCCMRHFLSEGFE